LDEDGIDGGANLLGNHATNAFYRLFGDVRGNRGVGFVDFLTFRNSFGSTAGDEAYDGRFDINNDDSVAFLDFLAFRSRLDSALDFE